MEFREEKNFSTIDKLSFIKAGEAVSLSLSKGGRGRKLPTPL